MHIKNKILIFWILFTLFIPFVDSYVLNKAKTISPLKIISSEHKVYVIGNKVLQMNTTLDNKTAILIKQLLNTDCRELESAGIQYGCSIYRIKVLKMLGVQIDQNTFTPSNPINRMPNNICYPDKGGYIEFNLHKDTIALFNDYKDFRIWKNNTYYNMSSMVGIRIYTKKGVLNKSMEINNSVVNEYDI